MTQRTGISVSRLLLVVKHCNLISSAQKNITSPIKMQSQLTEYLFIKSFMEELRPLYEWGHHTRGTTLPIRFLCQKAQYLNNRKIINCHSRILANPDARNNHIHVYPHKFSRSSISAERDLLFYFISLL